MAGVLGVDPGPRRVRTAAILAVIQAIFSVVAAALDEHGEAYGDITPVAKTAGALAQLEALAGMLFIAVFMERLVSLHSPGHGEAE